MLGSSRTSYAAVDEYLSSYYQAAPDRSGFFAAGQGCLQVADLLEGDSVLRATLADASREAQAKRSLGEQLLQGKVSATALDLLGRVFAARWGSAADMVDAVESVGTTLILMSAEGAGRLETVEEELFRFGRAIDANAPLQMALTDPANSARAKAGIVTSLLANRATAEATALLEYIAGHLRGRRVQAAVTTLSEMAAARHGRIVAEVRAAVALSAEQRRRLAAVLTKIQGRPVELNVIMDPSVIGGIEIRADGEVVDATVASGIEQARRRLTS